MSTNADRDLFEIPSAQISANTEKIGSLQEDVTSLRSALEDRGPIETSGPTVQLDPEDCDDLGAEVLDNQNGHFKLERGDYPIKTPIDLHANAN